MQDDLSLCRTHVSEGTFSDVSAQMIFEDNGYIHKGAAMTTSEILPPFSRW